MSKFSYMNDYANFFGVIGIAHKGAMYDEHKKMKEELERMKINQIQDPVKRQEALRKFNENKNNPLNQIGQNLGRVMSAL